jgi:hypothetical protein
VSIGHISFPSPQSYDGFGFTAESRFFGATGVNRSFYSVWSLLGPIALRIRRRLRQKSAQP